MGERVLDFLNEFAASLAAIMAYCAIVVGGGYILYVTLLDLPRQERADAAKAAAWTESEPPSPALALDMPEFIDAPGRHLVRRHQTGGGRRDLIVFDAPGERGPALAVEVYRKGTESEASGDAVTAIAARFAKFSAMAKSAPLLTKFGEFTLLRAQESGENGRLCVAFMRSFDDPDSHIAGLYCDRLKETQAVEVVACALDRLGLVNAGGDGRLAGLFARAQLRQSTCGPGKTPGASIAQRDAWIDAQSAPLLRNKSAQ